MKDVITKEDLEKLNVKEILQKISENLNSLDTRVDASLNRIIHINIELRDYNKRLKKIESKSDDLEHKEKYTIWDWFDSNTDLSIHGGYKALDALCRVHCNQKGIKFEEEKYKNGNSWGLFYEDIIEKIYFKYFYMPESKLKNEESIDDFDDNFDEFEDD
jgi:hypothetical protein